MTRLRFFRLLLQISLGVMVWASGVSRFFHDHDLTILYSSATLAFAVFSTIIFLVAERVASMKKLFTFNGLVSSSFLFKLIKAVAFLYAFESIVHPGGNQHLLHYILIYIVYTIFEVYFLIKISDAASSRL